MCGIAGFVGFDDPALLRAMTGIVAHRGPDDDGYLEEPGVALGHRRLSIIDLACGHQPISSHDDRCVVVYNGEIYNYRELRAELEEEGITFRTNSDTEVIVNLYAAHGASFARRLNGIFAVAIWDRRDRRLVLARDHLGVKPLLYLADDRVLLFASEVKSILQWSGLRRQLNPVALRMQMVYSFNPGDETLLRGVKKLPPGHVLTWQAGRVDLQEFWRVPSASGPLLGAEEHARRIRASVQAAVESQLVSDVPVGATLSGGLDSSAIVALMSRAQGRGVKTITVGFGGPKDELTYARLVAERYKTDHTEFLIDPSRFTSILPRVLWHLEEPMLGSILPTWFLGEAARRLVKVILIGEGADEVFGGYRRFWPVSDRFRRFTTETLRKRFYFWHFSALGLGDPGSVFTDGFLAGEGGRAVDPLRYYRSGMGAQDGDALNALLRFEQRYELADFQLSRVDRLTMAHSVEARVPYLDPRVVELANGIPSRFKVRGTREKDILRLAMKDLVPEVILERRKQGLGTPLIPWFGSGFREVARDLLSDSNVRARGVFDVRYVQRLFDSSKSRLLHREDLGKLFKIVMFEMWCRLFLDPTTAEYAEPEWAEFGATA